MCFISDYYFEKLVYLSPYFLISSKCLMNQIYLICLYYLHLYYLLQIAINALKKPYLIKKIMDLKHRAVTR